MIKIEHVNTYGWEAAIRGMRNPMNSWSNSDSVFIDNHDNESVLYIEDMNGYTNSIYLKNDNKSLHPMSIFNVYGKQVCIGERDHNLMMKLRKAGSDHGKFMRMISVSLDITAPLYWWKEFDTYKVGTVANSCSTMHKIQAKEFELGDFSHEHLSEYSIIAMDQLIHVLNWYRQSFNESKNKADWWQMIQLLPTSYNQKRIITLNYEVLHNMYNARKSHKLDEWVEFCNWIKTLPCSELITMEVETDE